MVPVVADLAAFCVLQLTGKGCAQDQGVWPIVKTCLLKLVEMSVLNGEDRPSIIRDFFWQDNQKGIGTSRLVEIRTMHRGLHRRTNREAFACEVLRTDQNLTQILSADHKVQGRNVQRQYHGEPDHFSSLPSFTGEGCNIATPHRAFRASGLAPTRNLKHVGQFSKA